MKPKTASLTLRVSPDTRQALDAAAEQRGVKVGTLAGQIMDAWAVQQSGRLDRQAAVHELLERASDAVTQVDNGYAPPSQLHAALRCIIRAVSTLNDA